MVSDSGTPTQYINLHNQPTLNTSHRTRTPTARFIHPSPNVSARMRLVRRRGTAAERQLARALRAQGLRFALHVAVCGCTPDIVFSFERLAIFVDGDFWHGRIFIENGRDALRESFKCQSRGFWVSKITRNVERDSRQVRLLRRNGWAVLRLWEKDIAQNPTRLAASIVRRLQRRRIRLTLGPDGV